MNKTHKPHTQRKNAKFKIRTTSYFINPFLFIEEYRTLPFLGKFGKLTPPPLTHTPPLRKGAVPTMATPYNTYTTWVISNTHTISWHGLLPNQFYFCILHFTPWSIYKTSIDHKTNLTRAYLASTDKL